MMNTIAILTTDARNLSTFVERNSARYNIVTCSPADVCKHRVVIFSSHVAKSILVRRLAWESNTYSQPHADMIPAPQPQKFHRADKQSYIYDNEDGAQLLTWEYISSIDTQYAQLTYDVMQIEVQDLNNTHLRQWCHQLYAYRPELKALTKASDLQVACDAITSELGYDVDAYSYEVVDKLSNFTCTDDRNQYLQRGESTSHSEDRGRIEFNYTSLLASVMNAVQSLAYSALGITDELDERAKNIADTEAYWSDVELACK